MLTREKLYQIVRKSFPRYYSLSADLRNAETAEENKRLIDEMVAVEFEMTTKILELANEK